MVVLAFGTPILRAHVKRLDKMVNALDTKEILNLLICKLCTAITLKFIYRIIKLIFHQSRKYIFLKYLFFINLYHCMIKSS